MISFRVMETRFRAIKIVVFIKVRSHEASLIMKEKPFCRGKINDEGNVMKKV